MIRQRIAQGQTGPHAAVAWPWLTMESALWGLLLVGALGLRLLKLDVAPLNGPEARDALRALRFAQGQGAPATTGYSPALFSGQWFAFLLFSASDVTARLLPALSGTALAMAPALLRRPLGRPGALLASALLTLSPTAVTLSRTASGDVLVALGAVLALAGLWRLGKHRGSPTADPSLFTGAWLSTSLLLPIGLGLMLVSGPLAYSALLSIGGALLLAAYLEPGWRSHLQQVAHTVRANRQLLYAGLAGLLGSYVLLSTAFGWHFGGLAAAADLLPQWLNGFVRWPDSLSFGYPALILVFYEPLILFLGGIGGVMAARRWDGPALLLALWSVGALILALVRPGRGPGDVLLILIPLACLGGLTLARILKRIDLRQLWFSEGLFVVIGLPIWAYILLNLATYTNRPGDYTYVNLILFEAYLPTFLTLVVATLILLIVLATGLGLIQGSRPALRGVVLLATVALSLLTVSNTWGASQNRPADPRELLVLEPTAPEVRLLRETLVRLSADNQKGLHGIDITALTEDPSLLWALRDFTELRVAEVDEWVQANRLAQTAGLDQFSEEPTASSIVIAPKALGTPPLGGGYIGQVLPLRRRWNASSLSCRWNQVSLGFDQVPQLDCSGLVGWFTFRRSVVPPEKEQLVLWVKQDRMNE